MPARLGGQVGSPDQTVRPHGHAAVPLYTALVGRLGVTMRVHALSCYVSTLDYVPVRAL